MAQYMVSINLPESIDNNFVSLIPDQRVYVDTLIAKGTILSYSLSVDRTKLWIIFSCQNEKEVAKYLNRFPIAEYLEYEIIELLFHNSPEMVFPAISLN
ncbi:MAG: hypothetical protein EAZ53_03350 [Bacteroidetes bacterium]|nr:MAG: hypothetical protein EAZ53_03350 [Bacteroidota bacterium]